MAKKNFTKGVRSSEPLAIEDNSAPNDPVFISQVQTGRNGATLTFGMPDADQEGPLTGLGQHAVAGRRVLEAGVDPWGSDPIPGETIFAEPGAVISELTEADAGLSRETLVSELVVGESYVFVGAVSD